MKHLKAWLFTNDWHLDDGTLLKVGEEYRLRDEWSHIPYFASQELINAFRQKNTNQCIIVYVKLTGTICHIPGCRIAAEILIPLWGFDATDIVDNFNNQARSISGSDHNRVLTNMVIEEAKQLKVIE